MLFSGFLSRTDISAGINPFSEEPRLTKIAARKNGGVVKPVGL
jgi:hypothetical protein